MQWLPAQARACDRRKVLGPVAMARPREFDMDEIVRETLFVFWRKGYEATSLRDIEEATGLGRMSLYNVFGDKEGLFQAVLERYIDATQRLYVKYLRGEGIADLEALIDAYTKPQRLGPAGSWGCLMLNAITAVDGVSPRAHRTIETFRRYAIDQIEAALRRASELGEVDRSMDFREMAEFILTTMWGAKAAIRHAGTAAAAAPVARLLPKILRGLGMPRGRSPRRL